jgi:hypothetical protein
MPEKINRFYTGVSFEPPVAAYLDDLSLRMGMNRSWVLNTIIYEYAKMMENKEIAPWMGRSAQQRSKEVFHSMH